MKYTREQVEATLKAKGYVYFEDANAKGFDVNIIGIRNSDTGQKVTNAFDDLLTLEPSAIRLATGDELSDPAALMILPCK